MKLKNIFPGIFFLFALNSLASQTIATHLTLRARTDRDSIVLRWQPSNAEGWRAANRLGYTVERAPLAADGKSPDGPFVKLNPRPLYPWTDVECLFNIHPSSTFAANAAEMLHGEYSVMTGPDESVRKYVVQSGDSLTDRFMFSLYAADNDPIAASVLALRYGDLNLRGGTRFLYRVFVAGRDSNVSFDTATVAVVVAPHSPVAAPTGCTAVGLDHVVLLRWKNFSDAFSAFTISRAVNDEINYQPLKKFPISATRFDDSTINNYNQYHYIIRGITPFGEASEPAAITASGRDLTPPHMPSHCSIKQLDAGRVLVSWRVDTVDADLDGFSISRGVQGQSGWHKISKTLLDSYKREFVDSAPSDVEYCYRVAAVDTSGNIAQSPPVCTPGIDVIAARAVTAEFDPTSRHVVLHWVYDTPLSPNMRFEIYRAVGNQELMVFKNADLDARMFEDADVAAPGAYRYAIRVASNAGEAAMSDVVLVNVP